jgi:hypothetical protein
LETPCFVSSIKKLKEDYVKELLVPTQGIIQPVITSAASQTKGKSYKTFSEEKAIRNRVV